MFTAETVPVSPSEGGVVSEACQISANNVDEG